MDDCYEGTCRCSYRCGRCCRCKCQCWEEKREKPAPSPATIRNWEERVRAATDAVHNLNIGDARKALSGLADMMKGYEA